MRLKKGSLFDYIHSYLKVYLPKQRNLSDNTIRSYRQSLTLFLDFVKDTHNISLMDVTFEMITPDAITGFLDSLEGNRASSISTRNNRLAAVRAFYKFVADRDIVYAATYKQIAKIPVKKPQGTKVVKYMSEEAVAAVIAQPDATKPKGLRDRFFMMLLYDTGARVQEIIDLKLGDFRYGKSPTATLCVKNNKIRTVPLMDKTILHLKQYLGIFHSNATLADVPLFYTTIHGQNNPMTDDCIRKFMRRYGNQARKICGEVPENIHPHMWRHSRAMHLYQRGMDLTLVSQWLGHSQIETTLIYAHADTEHKRIAIAAAHQNGKEPIGNISPKRFTVNDEVELKRLTGLI